jgi:hypothetical protein
LDVSDSSIKPETLLILGAVAGGLYLAYKTIQGVSAAAGAVGSAVATGAKAVYSGAQTLTAPVSNVITDAVLALNPLPASMNVPGNILFPDGTAAPLAQTPVYPDSAGNVYVKMYGSTWKLGPSDADGDWPATYVSG